MKTTFIFGINLLAAVPTTLRSVWFASYPSSKRFTRVTMWLKSHLLSENVEPSTA